MQSTSRRELDLTLHKGFVRTYNSSICHIASVSYATSVSEFRIREQHGLIKDTYATMITYEHYRDLPLNYSARFTKAHVYRIHFQPCSWDRHLTSPPDGRESIPSQWPLSQRLAGVEDPWSAPLLDSHTRWWSHANNFLIKITFRIWSLFRQTAKTH